VSVITDLVGHHFGRPVMVPIHQDYVSFYSSSPFLYRISMPWIHGCSTWVLYVITHRVFPLSIIYHPKVCLTRILSVLALARVIGSLGDLLVSGKQRPWDGLYQYFYKNNVSANFKGRNLLFVYLFQEPSHRRSKFHEKPGITFY
jgi:hypothetical protein